MRATKFYKYRSACVAAALVLCAMPALADEPAPPAPSASQPALGAVVEISRAAFSDKWAHGHRALTLLDVRSAEEFAAGHVPGAINIPVDQLETRMTELPSQNEIVVYCLSGVRSAQAIEFLRAREFKRLTHLSGDYADWESSGGPVETAAP